jgi:excisionase family DNA binding protein
MTTNEPTAVAASPLLLNSREVADLIGASPRTIVRLADSGRMPRPIKVGALTRWRRSELDAWIARGCPRVEGERREASR